MCVMTGARVKPHGKQSVAVHQRSKTQVFQHVQKSRKPVKVVTCNEIKQLN